MNLMKLEMMNAAERVGEALKTRGLFVRVSNDFVIMEESNTKADMKKIQDLLNQLGIPTLWQENRFQVLVNRIPISLMKKIIHAPGKEFPIHMEGYHYKWKAFAQRRFGIQVNALDLDPNMAMLVKTLNLAGITCLAGCNGHHRYAPNVQFSGVFQGAWFTIIQEMLLNNCSLHYKWKVHFGNQSGSCLFAEKGEQERWDMNFIYQDAVQMAWMIQKHSEEIRMLKKNTFKRSQEMKEKAYHFVQEKDFNGLVEWMRGLKKEAVVG